jgi:short-subunit dehydrogenase
MSLPEPAPDALVLITGASSGIGAELARRIGELGHDLLLVARRRDRLEALAAELRDAHGIEATAMAVDLADAAGRRRLVQDVEASGRFVAGLCNNAGFGSFGRVLELDAARENAMVQLNVAAVHELTLAFVRPMVAHRAGAILNVASIAANQPVPGMATYAATKAFVQSFSEALHAELAGTGVSCTVLSPGPVPTEFGEVAGTRGADSLVPGFVIGDAEDVATAAVRGMLRGRRTVVPGTATKALATGGRYVPRSILLEAARRATGGKGAE